VFVAISGFVMGSVYVRIIAHEGMSAALMRAFKRAWLLYSLTVLLTVSFAACAAVLGLWWQPHLTPAGAVQFFVGLVTLHQAYYLTDIPLMYTLLVLAAGPILVLLANGHWRRVLIGSWLIWILWQRWPLQTQLPWSIADFPTFNLSAWQVLFVTSMVLGYHRKWLEEALKRISTVAIMAGSGAVFAASVGLYMRGVTVDGRILGSSLTVEQCFGKADLRAGRLLVFAAFAVWIYSLLTLVWVPVRHALGFLLPLGEHSLSAYMIHLFVVAGLSAATASFRPELENTLVQAAGVVLVWCTIVMQTRIIAACHRVAQPWAVAARALLLVRVAVRPLGETPQLALQSSSTLWPETAAAGAADLPAIGHARALWTALDGREGEVNR